MMLGWLLGFSLLWRVLTDPVRAGAGVHQTRPKGAQMVLSLENSSENIQIPEIFMQIRLTIGLDVEKANIERSMVSFSQYLSRVKDSNKEDKTRSMMGPSRKKEGLKGTKTKVLRSKRSVPRGEENKMEDRRQCLMRASRRKEGRSIQKKSSRPKWSKLEDRRRCLRRALLRKKEMGLRIMKKNAMFSKK